MKAKIEKIRGNTTLSNLIQTLIKKGVITDAELQEKKAKK